MPKANLLSHAEMAFITEYPETAEEAPFAVDRPFMKMLNNEDRFKVSSSDIWAVPIHHTSEMHND